MQTIKVVECLNDESKTQPIFLPPKLTEKQLLLYPIPDLDIVALQCSSSNVSNAIKPDVIDHWDLSRLSHITPDDNNKQYDNPIFDLNKHVDCKERIKYQFLELVKPIFNKQILTNKDFIFDIVSATNLRNGYFANNSKPDAGLINTDNNRAVFVIEIKAPLDLEHFEMNRLKGQFSEKNTKNILKLFTYMVPNNNKYGLLSCNLESWFFMVGSKKIGEKTEKVLSISSVIDKNQLMLELFKVVQLAMDDPSTGIEIAKLKLDMPQNGPSRNGGDPSPRRVKDKIKDDKKLRDRQRGSSNDQTYKSVQKMITFEVDQSDCVGHGRSGNVYRAVADGQMVAVKYCTDPDLFGEMANEAEILDHLNRKECPNVPTLLHAYQKDQAYVIITQYIDGVHVKFSENKSQVQQALKAIHKCNVLHGDIKADNFLLTSDGKIYVIDFGFSKISSNESELKRELDDLRAELGLRPVRYSYSSKHGRGFRIK